jgi:thermolabile hemolysin
MRRAANEQRSRWKTWFIFPAVLMALFLTGATGYSFTAVYVFGDSLSDTGNNPPTETNYFNGRFSNGPLWVEYLSTNLGLHYVMANNFAVSGSTTSNLLSQIAGLPASTNLQTGLFTVLSGGNDFLDGAQTLGTNNSSWSNLVNNAVLNISNAVATLYTNGGREFVVGNLPNLGQTPSFAGSPAGFSNYVDSKVASFNILLAGAMTNAMQQHSGSRIYLADNNSFFSIVLDNPAAFGFTVTSVGALEDPNLANKSFTGPGANYLFWDVIHPTTKMHKLIAATAFDLVGTGLKLASSGTNLNLTLTNIYPTLSYTIQSSSNLTAWSNYLTFTATNTNAITVVTNKPGTKVYYRVGY